GQLSIVNFSTGFNAPVDIAHANDDRIFIVEQDGKIYIVNQLGMRNSTPFLDIDPRVNSGASERGLLGLAFHPDYAQNGYFFVNYTNTAGNTVVSRFSVTANPDIADPNSEEILLTITQPYSNHNGGCIKFGPDGYLYIGMGDGGSGGDPGNRSQNGMELLGKMLRIDVDNGSPYAIPASNPYVGSSTIRNEIWGFGLRNPWRFSFDKVTGDVWIGDVGQNALEEIDFWADTATTFPNFGWRCYEATAPYNTAGCQPQSSYDDPIYEFSHSQGNCSVTGGFVYRGARYQSMWGYYFHTDYCGGFLWQTHDNGLGGWTTTRSASTLSSNNLVSFGEDAYGEIYLAGGNSGIIYKLRDTTCTPMAYIPGGDTVTVCQPGGVLTCFGGPTLSYQWQLGGVDVSGAMTADLSATTAGDYRVIVRNGSCADTSNTVHVVLANVPTATLSLPSAMYCDFDPPVNAVVTPAGGTLVGPGTGGLFFDPSSAGVGTHDLVYFYTDSLTGCSASDTFSVTVTVCVGIDDEVATQLRLSPNPNSGIFQLQFQLKDASPYDIEILDMQGRRLHGIQYAAGAGLVTKSLDFRDLAAGMYFLRLKVGEQTDVLRFSVQQ
ncbi:MAG TPA: PQQ-dependent sugar dehydrogenase, partial [Bacteroidia bacterium]|nr:PQQ-dependent sugar dehydrogenase [Bacteroidia bacterium]